MFSARAMGLGPRNILVSLVAGSLLTGCPQLLDDNFEFGPGSGAALESPGPAGNGGSSGSSNPATTDPKTGMTNTSASGGAPNSSAETGGASNSGAGKGGNVSASNPDAGSPEGGSDTGGQGNDTGGSTASATETGGMGGSTDVATDPDSGMPDQTMSAVDAGSMEPPDAGVPDPPGCAAGDQAQRDWCGCGFEPSPDCAVLENDLVHRYSFDGNGTVLEDTAGSANGEVFNASLNGSGTLTLTNQAFVHLPDGIVSARTNASFEVWLTWAGGSDAQRIFSFGNRDSGFDQDYFMLTPRRGNTGPGPGNGSGGITASFTAAHDPHDPRGAQWSDSDRRVPLVQPRFSSTATVSATPG